MPAERDKKGSLENRFPAAQDSYKSAGGGGGAGLQVSPFLQVQLGPDELASSLEAPPIIAAI